MMLCLNEGTDRRMILVKLDDIIARVRPSSGELINRLGVHASESSEEDVPIGHCNASVAYRQVADAGRELMAMP